MPKNNHRGFGMEKKLGSERQDNRTLLGTLYLDIFLGNGSSPAGNAGAGANTWKGCKR